MYRTPVRNVVVPHHLLFVFYQIVQPRSDIEGVVGDDRSPDLSGASCCVPINYLPAKLSALAATVSGWDIIGLAINPCKELIEPIWGYSHVW